MRIPLSTYRIQFTPEFGFKQALDILPYLSDLGISDIYASPIFKARKGSTHGYDIVDPTQLNHDLGSLADLNELTDRVKRLDMGWLQDIVPNHMAYDGQNEFIMDVLENGEQSQYFHFFDIEWEHPYDSIRGRILAPFLGAFYGRCLENGEIVLQYDQNGLTVRYYEHRFPLKIESYATVFTFHIGMLKDLLGSDHPDYIKLLGVLYSLKNLPSEQHRRERYEQIKFVKRMLWELYNQNADIHRHIDESVEAFNGQVGIPESFNQLDHLLAEQFFRLAFWKVGNEELNYRRFFNINGLITVKIEDEDVYLKTHTFIAWLLREGKITGLRIDHLDGLYNPLEYLVRLRRDHGGSYIVVEKILEHGEDLPVTWPVQGTTGYEFLNLVNGLFCRRESEAKFDRIYRKFTGVSTPYPDLVVMKKRLIIDKHMTSDVDNLAHLAARISSRHRYGSDFTMHGLRRALVEVLAHFPVYRTYLGTERTTEADESCVREVIGQAKEKSPDLEHELNFVEDLLLLNFDESIAQEERRQWLYFVMRFQQFTGPLMAKGFEDTVLYIYSRLLSLNEVGGNPNKFGTSAIEFHHISKKRANLWPHSMNATSTHDTKRGEDVRARINVLSEIPDEWQQNVNTWTKINRKRKPKINGVAVPDKNDEYFLYQTLIGSFPFSKEAYPEFLERIKSYIVKAVREAKVHTAWLKPDVEYEESFIAFVEKILAGWEENDFLSAFLPFQKKIAFYGIFNSLSQILLKIASPGMPDIYQGSELWDLSLVDPDNRRPVDYEQRRSLLNELKGRAEADISGLPGELFRTREDGRLKLFLIWRALAARKEYREVFENGSYVPVEVGGRFRDHVLAFAKCYEDRWSIAVVPRFLCFLIQEGEYPVGEGVWQDTHMVLPTGITSLREMIAGFEIQTRETLRIGDAFRHFPAALLTGTGNESISG